MNYISRIAIICNYELLPERIGGMDYFFWMFDQKCKENGIDIDWFFPNEGSHGNYDALNIIASGSAPETFFIKKVQDDQQAYSHVITHFIELCTKSFKSIKKLTNAQIIAIDHNPRPLGGYPLKKRTEKKVKGLLYSRFIDVFVAVSEQTKRELVSDFGNFIRPKCIVIFNGLSPDKFKRKTSFNHAGKFIIACHLRESKGIQDVISAVANLKNKREIDFTIDIYGTGPFEGNLKNMVKELSLNAFFDFKGSVTNLNTLYADYDYLIHPSHAETFCYTVVESVMSNLPVITTKRQGNVLGLIKANSNGFLYEPGDSGELENILSDISEKKIVINDALASNSLLNELTLDRMVENYFKLLS